MVNRRQDSHKDLVSQKWFYYSISCLIVLALYLYLIGVARAEEITNIHPQITMKAIRANPHAPMIDGILNDEVWQHAPISDDFIQKDPKEGQQPTERTTIQIAYDNEALYVGVMCYDNEPDKVVAQLTRREMFGWLESDSINLLLDTYHDHRTGFRFLVNAVGVKSDGQIFDDGGDDGSWDGIWEAKTNINAHGWSVEYKIPYHTLRFNPKEEYVWGMCVGRHISRRNENDHWALIKTGIPGLVSQFGHIEGIRGIHSTRHLELLPFAVGRSKMVSDDPDGMDIMPSMGVDLRYGISTSISLNATINPDFGQVESDPAVLNLSAFETFYEERRPFFVEGSATFGTPGSCLFYSRRIGRQPGRFPIPEDSRLIEKPDSTTILSAVKLSGKTAGKTAFGIMNAVTANEYATIERTYNDPMTGEQIKQEKYLIEPMTNFLVGRVKQDVLKSSNVGAMLTAVNRNGDVPAYTGEVDGSLKWSEGKYSISTRLAGSRSGTASDRKSGYEGVFHYHEWHKWIGGGLNLDARSPEFNTNDLGFMNRAGVIDMFSFIHLDINKPILLARNTGFYTCQWLNWNYDGINIGKGFNFYQWIELKNNWFSEYCVSRGFKTFDDTTTRGGPVMVQWPNVGFFANLGTDGRKPISFWLGADGSRADEGLNKNIGVSLGMGIKPASNIQLNIGPSYRTDHITYQWVRNVNDANGRHYVFGSYEGHVINLNMRANVSFTPDISFQFYAQPFVAVGDYRNFTELAHPRSYEFESYNVDFNPDFVSRSLRGNAIFRWEYRPGSVLFVVWSQSRGTFIETENPALSAYDNLRDSVSDKGENVFLVKLNYWLGL